MRRLGMSQLLSMQRNINGPVFQILLLGLLCIQYMGKQYLV